MKTMQERMELFFSPCITLERKRSGKYAPLVRDYQIVVQLMKKASLDESELDCFAKKLGEYGYSLETIECPCNNVKMP